MLKIYAEAIEKANEILDAGGTTMEIRGAKYQRGVIRDLVGGVAEKRGYNTAIQKLGEDFLVVCFTPRKDEPGDQGPRRGKPKSPIRVLIESIAPGGFDTVDLCQEDVTVQKVRALVAAVSDATGRRFATQTVDGGTTLMITRIDGASVPVQRPSRSTIWPFGRMEVGQTEFVLGGKIESARSMANHWKRKRGMTFRVSKTTDGVTIKRLI